MLDLWTSNRLDYCTAVIACKNMDGWCIQKTVPYMAL